ncbi:phosphoribosylformylglycinamidine synthase subunit PurL [Halarsenatibacter silvermanii]|uniref:Phosphoribosylformylglycinamidine synthase subunit PurL n=1 Tax=Halarsenatibacter silvermanii TaxID=321763 RepID=A0A1G9PUE3_9FIRM|nr:phosphoribosylformylglycinamidine synthase subunit PurL [Halarsenatibacter silvermanii]SDM02374.1 phosphoribosylformylglycinamidine synthase subunit II [Halarsenatibacter silvermanii]
MTDAEGNWQQEGLTAEEYDKICSDLNREPNRLELGMYGVMWSEHCSYKNSRRLLKKLPSEGEKVIQGPGENAGIVDLGEGLAAAFKVESHNHPSAVAPFKGAATGLGGIARDVISVGSRPAAALGAICLGELESERSQWLAVEAVDGILSYGKGIDVPTVRSSFNFSQAYESNPLVNAMCVGILPADREVRARAGSPGSLIILAGAATGTEGVSGASFASDELSAEEENGDKSEEVPAGRPEIEKRLISASLEIIEEDLLIGLQDLGAAGITGAASEMAGASGTGIELELEKVPLTSEDPGSYEIMLAETQERMMFSVEKSSSEKVLEILRSYDLEAEVIGTVIEDKILRVKEGEKTKADLPVGSLTEGFPIPEREMEKPDYPGDFAEKSSSDISWPGTLKEAALEMLRAPGLGANRWFLEKAGNEGRKEVLNSSEECAGALMLPDERVLVADISSRGHYCHLDPRLGSKLTTAEVARSISSCGAKPLAVTDGLNFGSPENPGVYWQLNEGIEGIGEVCRELDLPVIGGNVSLYNEGAEGSIFPTPVIGMIGIAEKDNYITSAFKKEGDVIYLLGETKAELGGSEFVRRAAGENCGSLPDLDLDQEKNIQKVCRRAAAQNLLKSACSCGSGGLFMALAAAAVSGDLGASLELNGDLSLEEELFAETPGRILVSLSSEKEEELIDMAADKGAAVRKLGQVGKKEVSLENRLNISLEEMKSAWNSAISGKLKG